ncbi:MAG TPA: carboxypeptidase-like regulatory domain-containing protein, partial [Gemmatimonadales bacterium]|nr:carboxypeptidase-like regulatory domain-containing protein [Gemmatimonadales bacterium]
ALAAAPTAAAPTLESEARRIFGRPSTKLGPLAGSRENRPWESPIPLSSGCTLPPPDPRDSLPPGMGQVSGIIYREDNGQPLPGARLQILGTPYGTFADGRGQYRLVFDRSLVDGCRTQAVRVSAPGYQSRDVILYLGDRPNSDVSLPRY